MQRSEVEALIRRHLRKYALKDEIASVGPFTSNSAIATDANGDLVEATGVTKTELEMLSDISTALTVQTQLTTLGMNKQNTVEGVSSAKIGMLTDIDTSSTIQTQLDAKLSNPHAGNIEHRPASGGIAVNLFTTNVGGNNMRWTISPYWGGPNAYHDLCQADMYYERFRISKQCSAASYHTHSDDRLKHNEENISDALGDIKKLAVRKYLKSGEMYEANHTLGVDAEGNYTGLNAWDSVKSEIGVIAQELEQIPELAWTVDGRDASVAKSVDYNSLFTLNIQATQELAVLVESQAATIIALEARVAALEARL